MFFSRIHRRFTTGLAMLALVMSALAPTVSQAVVMSSDRGDWLEVCTTTGVMWVKADSAATDDGTMPMVGHDQGCDICTHTVTGAPPASAALTVSAIDQSSRLFQARSAPAHPAPFWAMAQSRAPPLYA
jgi:CMP-N-acetylneuraminic acid synthetase